MGWFSCWLLVTSDFGPGPMVAFLTNCAMPCATPLHLHRRRYALSMGLENEKLDDSSTAERNGGGRVPGACRDGAARLSDD
jgi:hypothetical protein